MKEPTVTLQVTCRNYDNDEDSDDEANNLNVGMLNPNDISGLETREGERVTLEANSNAKSPTEASVSNNASCVRHVTRSE